MVPAALLSTTVSSLVLVCVLQSDLFIVQFGLKFGARNNGQTSLPLPTISTVSAALPSTTVFPLVVVFFLRPV
jgi:ABC-type anion transport system duplicated permease subunit